MKRRGLFGLFAAAPVLAVSAASSAFAAQVTSSNKEAEPEFIPPKIGIIKIHAQRPESNLSYMYGIPAGIAIPSPDPDAYASLAVDKNGNLYISSNNGKYRKILTN